MASGRTPIDWVIEGSREAGEAVDPRYAVRCLLDWIGVALAGAAEPTVAVVARAFTPGDDFYEALIEAHRDLDDERSELLNARLVLLLANHIGDLRVLREALHAAREGL